MSSHVNFQSVFQSKALVALSTGIWFLAGVNALVTDDIFLSSESLAAETTSVRFLSSVRQHVYGHVMRRQDLATDGARDMILARMGPEMLLYRLGVERLEVTEFALIALALGRVIVNFDVLAKISGGSIRGPTNLAHEWPVIRVNDFVDLQRRLVVEALVALLAKVRVVLVVQLDVQLQRGLGTSRGTANVANVRSRVDGHVSDQSLLCVEKFIAIIALHWPVHVDSRAVSLQSLRGLEPSVALAASELGCRIFVDLLVLLQLQFAVERRVAHLAHFGLYSFNELFLFLLLGFWWPVRFVLYFPQT